MEFFLSHHKMKQPFPARNVYETRSLKRAMREHPELFGDLKPVP